MNTVSSNPSSLTHRFCLFPERPRLLEVRSGPGESAGGLPTPDQPGLLQLYTLLQLLQMRGMPVSSMLPFHHPYLQQPHRGFSLPFLASFQAQHLTQQVSVTSDKVCSSPVPAAPASVAINVKAAAMFFAGKGGHTSSNSIPEAIRPAWNGIMLS